MLIHEIPIPITHSNIPGTDFTLSAQCLSVPADLLGICETGLHQVWVSEGFSVSD